MSDTPSWSAPEPGQEPPPATGPGWGSAPQSGGGWQPQQPGQWGQQQWGPPPGQQQWGPGQQQWGNQWSTAKPGVIPLRPLGLGEVLDGAVTTMRTYPKATLGFAAMVAVVTQVLSFLWFLSLQSTAASATSEDALVADFFLGVVLLGILGFIANLVLTGCITVVIGQAVLGRPVSLAEAWARVRPRIWALIGVSLLGGLIVIGGLLLLVLPGIYFVIAFSLATPALILENQSVTRSLRRSWDLIKGSWWRIFGIVLLTNIVAGVVGQVLQVPFGVAGGFASLNEDFGDITTGALALQMVGGIIAATVTGPFVAGVSALLYIDMRMRREGLDVTLAATASTTGPGGTGPGAGGTGPGAGGTYPDAGQAPGW